MIDIGLFITYGLLILALTAAVVIPTISAVKSPKELGKSMMGLGVLAVIFLISYVLSGSEVTAKYTALGVNESSSKFIGAGLTMFYIILFVSIIGIVASEINKALK